MSKRLSFIYATDFHFGMKTRIRKDDVEETLFEKTSFILNHKKEGDVLLLGGDLLDRPDGIPTRTISRLMDLFDYYNVNKDNTFVVFGQHEIFGHNPKSIRDSQLHLFERAGYFTLLHGRKHIVQINGVNIVGFSWNDAPTKQFLVGEATFSSPSLCLLHASLSPLSEHSQFAINPAFLSPPEHCLLVLCGDIHDGFGQTGKFVNPGAVIRKKRKEAKRRVAFLRGEVRQDFSVSFEYVDIPVKEDVFLEAPLPYDRFEEIKTFLSNIDKLHLEDAIIQFPDPVEEIIKIARSRGYTEVTINTLKDLFDEEGS